MAIDPNTGLIQLNPPPVPGEVTTGSVTQAPQAPESSTTPTTPQPIPPVASYTPVAGQAGSATSTGYTATPYNVDPLKGTVAGQMKGLLEQESPYLQVARTHAREAMNERGLINSSIAISAGEKAAIESALPIATADANIYNQAMTNTVNQTNAATQFGAAAQNSAAQLNAQLLTSMNTTNANAANAALSQEAQAANQRALAQIDVNTKMELAVLDTQNRALLQSSVGASNAYVQAITNIANISTNPSLTQGAKDAAIQTQINMLREQLRTIGYISSTDSRLVEDLNLDEFFETTVPEPAAPPAEAPAWYTAPPAWYNQQPQPQPTYY